MEKEELTARLLAHRFVLQVLIEEMPGMRKKLMAYPELTQAIGLALPTPDRSRDWLEQELKALVQADDGSKP